MTRIINFAPRSVANWKDKFLITEKKAELQTEVEQVIYALLGSAEAMINQPQKSAGIYPGEQQNHQKETCQKELVILKKLVISVILA